MLNLTRKIIHSLVLYKVYYIESKHPLSKFQDTPSPSHQHHDHDVPVIAAAETETETLHPLPPLNPPNLSIQVKPPFHAQ